MKVKNDKWQPDRVIVYEETLAAGNYVEKVIIVPLLRCGL